MVGPDTRGVRGEWYRVLAEMDCPAYGEEFTLVDDKDHAQVSLQLEPGLGFTKAGINKILANMSP
jgi:hypothetical protein